MTRGSTRGLPSDAASSRSFSPTALRRCGASSHLLDNGYYVPPIVQIGVPKDQPRLRFFISAMHTEAEIKGVTELLAKRRTRREAPARSLSATG